MSDNIIVEPGPLFTWWMAPQQIGRKKDTKNEYRGAFLSLFLLYFFFFFFGFVKEQEIILTWKKGDRPLIINSYLKEREYLFSLFVRIYLLHTQESLATYENSASIYLAIKTVQTGFCIPGIFNYYFSQQ